MIFIVFNMTRTFFSEKNVRKTHRFFMTIQKSYTQNNLQLKSNLIIYFFSLQNVLNYSFIFYKDNSNCENVLQYFIQII